MDLADTFGTSAFSADGSLLAFYLNSGWTDDAWSGELSVYDAASGARRWHRRIDEEIVPGVTDDGSFWSQVAFAAAGTRLLCGSASGDLLAFDAASGELTGRTPVREGPLRSFGLAGSAVWFDGGGGPVGAPGSGG
jgi:hypothetical protein